MNPFIWFLFCFLCAVLLHAATYAVVAGRWTRRAMLGVSGMFWLLALAFLAHTIFGFGVVGAWEAAHDFL